ncbi:MAG: PAS domain S-box protein [Chitinophagaceae bacterium]|nr:PAS domain S-box protein [Chitinophagaceae bacterium]
MRSNKLLARQIKKFFPGSLQDDPSLQLFLQAVNDSYNAYERDNELASRAFAISEEEYMRVNEKLAEEAAVKKLSIDKLKETIKEIDQHAISQDNNEILDIISYLKLQIHKRKNAEDELRRLSLVASANNNGVVYTNPAGQIFWCNDGFCKITGFTSSEIIGRTPVELLKGENTDSNALQLMINLFRGGKNFDVEMICYKKDRSWFWGRATGQSILDKDGSVVQYFAVVEDITREKVAQQKLQEFENRFRTALEKIGDNVWEYDLGTGHTYFSSSFNHLQGHTSQSSVDNGRLWWKQIHPEDRRIFLQKNKNYKKGLIDHHTVEYRTVAPDGSVRWILDRGVVIERYETGKPLRIVGTHTDITERKLSEQALRINEEKYRGIIANMNLGLLEVDNNEIIQFVNQSFCKISGYEPGELIGMKASALFARSEAQELIEGKNALRKNGISDAYEITVRNKNGELRWWLISGAPRYNDTGELVGSIGIHLDITDQKQLELDLHDARESAEQSTRAKESFLANMSHEIRTPMNAIMGMGHQLSKTILDDKQAFFLDTINRAAEHLLVVINDILDMSKIEAGKLAIEQIGFKPDEVIKHCLQVMKHRAEEKGLLLTNKMEGSKCPVLLGDPFRLTQILLNLISNAVKFTDKGTVDVLCKLFPVTGNRQTLSITVKDTGIGMNKEFLENLFQKFTQEDKTTARKYGGTGLGLPICKELIELMHGSIKVKSVKGAGTEVNIAIPFIIGTAADLPEDKKPEQDDFTLKGKRILLVEDNEMNRLVATTVLNNYGAVLYEAVNGEEAIAALRNSHYDIVLMDVQMPVMNGLDATRLIRKEINKKIPIIALTANVIKGESDKCLEAGMNGVVSKPFTEETLVYEIKRLMQKVQQPSGKTKLRKEPLYELSKLKKISQGNTGFVEKMVQLFIDQTPRSVIEIERAAKENRFDTVRAVAHKIKPTIDNMGIGSLYTVVREIEKYAEDTGSGEALFSNIAMLKEIIDEVITALLQHECKA